ncbi:cadmium-translocating P-type ATPase [Sphingobium terrigena]|uniref:Cadmium-translocating P-type ATPase n=2 Tax=Sphingobium terrigena TaxID=2304063 RepID=A0A418YXQ6_9SPHN|nr:heavy metal translocating P-type ATPase [Sphingobium terrigena]RJG57401.1 cadmium-translocating P-type ATPase [Sphingobium terrigena]
MASDAKTILPERATIHSIFAVPDMHCAGCIAKVERGLANVPGIVSARVNYSARRVTIEHDQALSPPELRAAIAGIGFAAEPLADPMVDDGQAESKTLLKALAVAGFASMNIMLLSVSIWSGADGATRDLFHWLSALIALPTVAYAGQPFFRSAFSALRAGRTNMDVPISIGVLLATGMSLFETITGGRHAWFDGAVMLLTFLLAGRWLDGAMRGKARDGVAALLRQSAPGAYVVRAGQRKWVAARSLTPGMMMQVAAGERFAADGEIRDGRSSIDLSFLTGESQPKPVSIGDMVHAGALNVDGPLTVIVRACGPDTVIADIARMMDAAGQGKSRYVRIADRAARIYAPAVHLLAALSFAGWMIAGAGIHQSLLIATAVLLITCPCALGLAVPAAQVVACGALMRRGILVKDGSALERLAEADRAIFDKTGTLTLGRPEPINLASLTHEKKSIVLALARASRHPLSIALAGALQRQGIVAAMVDDLQEVPGVGMRGSCAGHPVALERPSGATAWAGLATQFMFGSRRVLLTFADALRPDAVSSVARLRVMGLEPIIASGDRPEALHDIAIATDMLATGRMTPQAKLAMIERLKAQGHRVLMVGDGLNDGPALAAGHVSLAPSSASDASQLAADAVFLGDSLAPVAIAVRAARRTLAVVRQNFALAIGYNLLAVPLAIAGMVTPLVAALAMSGSSIVVVANALRLRNAAK